MNANNEDAAGGEEVVVVVAGGMVIEKGCGRVLRGGGDGVSRAAAALRTHRRRIAFVI